MLPEPASTLLVIKAQPDAGLGFEAGKPGQLPLTQRMKKLGGLVRVFRLVRDEE